jgi:hypothetical protein
VNKTDERYLSILWPDLLERIQDLELERDTLRLSVMDAANTLRTIARMASSSTDPAAVQAAKLAQKWLRVIQPQGQIDLGLLDTTSDGLL